MRVMTCNVHATSEAREVGKWMRDILDQGQGVDVVLLQELTQQHRAQIRSRTRDTHRLLVGNERPGADEVGVLIHRDIKVVRHYNVPMGRRGWWGHHVRKEHTPRNMRVVQLKSGLHIASIHTPPGVDCTPHGLTGPADRQRAWKQWYQRFRTWASSDFDFIAGGDWNEHARVRFPWSPRALGQAIALGEGGRPVQIHSLGTIDYLMTRGVQVSGSRLERIVPKGFDHLPGIYDVEAAT